MFPSTENGFPGITRKSCDAYSSNGWQRVSLAACAFGVQGVSISSAGELFFQQNDPSAI
jgi:hypothetical protein